MAAVTITIRGRDAKIRSPYSAKDLIKAMPFRWWDPEERCWEIPADDVDELRAVLEADGYHVVVIHAEHEHHTPPPPRNSRPSGDTWADRMFCELAPELADRAYKALLRALHPDAGGDTAQMQILNAARDRYRGRA